MSRALSASGILALICAAIGGVGCTTPTLTPWPHWTPGTPPVARLLGPDANQPGSYGMASAIVLDSDHLLTCRHVVEVACRRHGTSIGAMRQSTQVLRFFVDDHDVLADIAEAGVGDGWTSDWAVMRILTDMTGGIALRETLSESPQATSELAPAPNDVVFVAGYPSFGGGDLVIAVGTVDSVAADGSFLIRGLQTRSGAMPFRSDTVGISGSPVIAAGHLDATPRVIGMVVAIVETGFGPWKEEGRLMAIPLPPAKVR